MLRPARVLPLLIITSTLSVGCSGGVTQPSPRPIGQPFDLPAGASAVVEGQLKLTFDRVTSDSRCPMNALCVWAGNAVVSMSLSQGAGAPAAHELHTEAGRSEVSYLGYSIRLVSLAPYPRTDREIRPADYVATLAVTAR